MNYNFNVIITNGFLELKYMYYKCINIFIKISKRNYFRSVDRFYVKRYIKKNLFFYKLKQFNFLFNIFFLFKFNTFKFL